MTVSTMLSLLSEGFVTSLLIFALTLLFSMPLGLAVMFGRRSRLTPLRGFIKAYISIMRGTPLMLQLMVVFYGPKLLLGGHRRVRHQLRGVFCRDLPRRT